MKHIATRGKQRLVNAAREATHAVTRFGEKHDIEWLIYNPVTMLRFHQLASRDGQAMIAAFREIFPQARTFVDVGAGSCAIAAAAHRQGMDVTAIERSRFGRFVGKVQRVPVAKFDLTQTPASSVSGTRFDVAYCLEVAEHVPAELGDALVTFLASAADNVVFTAAPPGQDGVGHIHLQPQQYWIERFEQAGARYDKDRSGALSAAMIASGVTGPWYINNVMVFSTTG